MKMKTMLTIAVLGLLIAGCSSEEPNGGKQGGDMVPNQDAKPLPTTKDIVLSRAEEDAMQRFVDLAFDMNALINENYTDIFEQNDDNYNFSPISTVMCMSLIANSVDEVTSARIAERLGMESLDRLNALNTKLLQYLPAKENAVDMRLANSVWYHNSDMVSDSYRDKMAQSFAASVYGCDFNSTASVDEVNAWAARNTENMITKIIDKLDADGEAMFVNAMYFAGCWRSPFDKSATASGTFYGTLGDKNVAVMNGKFLYKYFADDEIEAVVVPFSEEKYVLDIVMPKDINNVSLTQDVVSKVHDGGALREVAISLPRFELEMSARLNPVLYHLSLLPVEFTFGQMGFANPRLINGILMKQNTRFCVDEEGAKAAAVTYGGGVTSPGIEYESVSFNVNRPFYYIIRNVKTGAIIMMGRVCNI